MTRHLGTSAPAPRHVIQAPRHRHRHAIQLTDAHAKMRKKMRKLSECDDTRYLASKAAAVAAAAAAAAAAAPAAAAAEEVPAVALRSSAPAAGGVALWAPQPPSLLPSAARAPRTVRVPPLYLWYRVRQAARDPRRPPLQLHPNYFVPPPHLEVVPLGELPLRRVEAQTYTRPLLTSVDSPAALSLNLRS